MGFTRKELMLFVTAFAVTVLVVILTAGYVSTAKFKNQQVRDELFELTVLLTDEYYDGARINTLLDRTIAKGYYGRKERRAKDYFSQLNNVVKTLETTVRSNEFINLVSYQTIMEDMPEYKKIDKKINDTYKYMDTFLNDYLDLMDEETVRKYISDEEVIKTLEIEKNRKVMARRVNDYKGFIEDTDAVIEFLKTDKNWKIENPEDIIFTDKESSKTFDTLVTSLDYTLVYPKMK